MDLRLSVETVGQVLLRKGTSVWTDGNVVHYEGRTFTCPHIRGTLGGNGKEAWLVRPEQYDGSDVAPVMAPRKEMVTANGGNPMKTTTLPRNPTNVVQQDEAVVRGSINAGSKVSPRQNYQGQNVTNTPIMQRTAREQSTNPGRAVQVVTGGGMQEGVVVKTNRVRASKEDKIDLERVTAAQVIKHVETEMLTDRGGGEEPIQKALETVLEGNHHPSGASKRSVSQSPEEAMERAMQLESLRAKQASSQQSGFNLHTYVGAPQHDVSDLSGLSSEDHAPMVEKVESGGISFTTTNGPGSLTRAQKKSASKKSAKQSPSMDISFETPLEVPVTVPIAPVSTIPTLTDKALAMKVKMVRRMCPEFPEDYPFQDPPKRRMAFIQYRCWDQPNVIAAIFSVETPEFQNMLVEEFPEALRDPAE